MDSQWPGAVKKLVNRVSTGESPVTLKQNKNEYYTISAQDCFVVISVLASLLFQRSTSIISQKIQTHQQTPFWYSVLLLRSSKV
jgi:hypothetical protein